jgi:hypothetical protein
VDVSEVIVVKSYRHQELRPHRHNWDQRQGRGAELGATAGLGSAESMGAHKETRVLYRSNAENRCRVFGRGWHGVEYAIRKRCEFEYKRYHDFVTHISTPDRGSICQFGFAIEVWF